MWRILTIAVFLAVILPIDGQEKTPQSRGNQSHTGSDEKPLEPPRTATCAIEDNGTTIKCNWSEAKPESYFKRLFSPENAPNIGLFFVGLGAIFAAGLTLQAIRLQAKAQMDADRAWILVNVYAQPEQPLTKQILKGITPGLIWQVQIFGNTPAKIISEKHRCHIVPVVEGFFPPKPQLQAVPTYPQRGMASTNRDGREFADSPIMYAPGYKDLRSIALETGIDPMGQMVAVTQAKAAWCAYGKIEYEDAFGRKGVTQFCAVYSPQLGGVIQSPDGTVLNPPGFRIGGPPGYNYNK